MSSDASCPSEAFFGDPVQPIVGDHTFHDLAAYIAGGCTAASVILCFGLCFMHLCTYRDRTEQRQIARIVLTPAIISIFDFLGIVVIDASGFLKAAGEYYDSVALVSLYLLLVNYATQPQQRGGPRTLFGLIPNLHAQYSYQSAKNVGLAAYFRTWFFVFQIIPVRFITMIATMVVDGTVCKQLESKNRANTIVSAITTVSTVMCFLAVIRFMGYVKPALAGRRPIMKTIALKGVVAFAVLLTFVFSILKGTNALKTSTHFDLKDLYIALPDLLICAVGLIFSILIVIPYNTSPYTASAMPNVEKLNIFVALFDVINITDILMGVLCLPSAFASWKGNPDVDTSASYPKNDYAPQNAYGQQNDMAPAMPPADYRREGDYEMGRQ